jgi:hypothetical protein
MTAEAQIIALTAEAEAARADAARERAEADRVRAENDAMRKARVDARHHIALALRVLNGDHPTDQEATHRFHNGG